MDSQLARYLLNHVNYIPRPITELLPYHKMYKIINNNNNQPNFSQISFGSNSMINSSKSKQIKQYCIPNSI